MKHSVLRWGLAALLALSLCFLLSPAALAAMTVDDARTKAEQLQALGLFRGVNEGGAMELNRTPTRTETLVMLIRLLGKEEEALAYQGACPFSDVAGWATSYVAWAYDQGLTRGVSVDTFGGDGAATLNMYLTFVLRALGFEEGAQGDFTWDEPTQLAGWWLEPVPYAALQEPFLRADVAVISHAALSARVKLTRHTLAEALTEEGVFTRETFDAAYDATPYAELTYGQALSRLRRLESDDAELTLLAQVPGHGEVYEVRPMGAPHAVNGFYLVFTEGSYVGEGRTLKLEVPLASAWLNSTPEDITLSEDGLTLTYRARGYARADLSGGAGPRDYFYTLDLTTGQTKTTSQLAGN